MLVAETALLQAIRTRLIDGLPIAEERCDIELDDQVPAIAAEKYCAITSAGVTPGPRHRTSGGVIDVTISAKVTLYHRIPHIARDRRRNVFIDLLTGLNAELDTVISLLDFDYQVLDLAVAMLPGTQDVGGEFPEPFRRFSITPSPRTVLHDPYDAAPINKPPGDPIVALARSVTFHDARFMKLRE